MQRARAFFFVSLGILALAAAFHLGATTAQGQAPGNPVVAAVLQVGPGFYALTANGDVYHEDAGDGSRWTLRGNVFTGTPVQGAPSTWGRVKADRR